MQTFCRPYFVLLPVLSLHGAITIWFDVKENSECSSWQSPFCSDEWIGRNLLKWMNPLKLRSKLGLRRNPLKITNPLVISICSQKEYPYPSHIHELHIHDLRWLVAFDQIRPETFLLTATFRGVLSCRRSLATTDLYCSYCQLDYKRTS